MKAIVYTEYGPPEVLHLQEVPKPIPKDNELLIRVHAVAVNYGDLSGRNFKNIPVSEFNMPALLMYPAKVTFGLKKPKNPILGSEFAGEVEAVGKAVKKFKPGDPVFGYLGMSMGAYAEYLCMPESGTIALKPSNMSFEEAATIPYGGNMALNLLRKVNVQSGQKVLVNGASGSIGTFALQLAKYFGAEVTGVAGTPRQEYMKALGADHVIDYTREDFTQNGEQYDLIFDVLGRAWFPTCKNSLTPRGVLLHVSFKGRHLLQMLKTSLSGGKKVLCALSGDSGEDLDYLRELAEAGHLKTLVDKTFSMKQAAAAHRYVEKGEKKGNVLILMGDSMS